MGKLPSGQLPPRRVGERTTTAPGKGHSCVKGHEVFSNFAASLTSVHRGTLEGPSEGSDANHLHGLLIFTEHLLSAGYAFGRLKKYVF